MSLVILCALNKECFLEEVTKPRSKRNKGTNQQQEWEEKIVLDSGVQHGQRGQEHGNPESQSAWHVWRDLPWKQQGSSHFICLSHQNIASLKLETKCFYCDYEHLVWHLGTYQLKIVCLGILLAFYLYKLKFILFCIWGYDFSQMHTAIYLPPLPRYRTDSSPSMSLMLLFCGQPLHLPLLVFIYIVFGLIWIPTYVIQRVFSLFDRWGKQGTLEFSSFFLWFHSGNWVIGIYVKKRDPIFWDHQVKTFRFLRSCTEKDQVKFRKKLFSKTWALCWKDIRTKNQHYFWIRSVSPGLLLKGWRQTVSQNQ